MQVIFIDRQCLKHYLSMGGKEELSKSNKDFIKHFDENNDIGYFLEVDVEYPKHLFNFHEDLTFLKER